MFGVSYVHSFWIAGLECDLRILTAVSVTGYSGEEWVFLKRRDWLQVQVNIDFCQERAVIVVIFNEDLHETKYADEFFFGTCNKVKRWRNYNLQWCFSLSIDSFEIQCHPTVFNIKKASRWIGNIVENQVLVITVQNGCHSILILFQSHSQLVR